MKRNAVIPLVLGLTIGLVAVKFGIDAIRRAKASNTERQSFTAIRAKVDIGAYEEIKPDMVEAIETSDTLFAPPTERIGDVSKAVGRVTCKSIPKAAPVLMSMLAPEGTKPGMVGKIPPGYRGVSVKIDEVSGVAYQIKPGDWVDVSVVMDLDSGIRGKKDVISEVLLQRVQVAAVGYGQQDNAPDSASKVKPAKSATLLVKDDDVPKLHLAMTRGKITLALRGADDESTEPPATAYGSEIGGKSRMPEPKPEKNLAELMAMMRKAEPVEEMTPALPHQVSVYHRQPGSAKGQMIEQITFENAKSSKIVAVQMGQPSRAAAALGVNKAGASRPLNPPPPVPPVEEQSPGSEEDEEDE